MKGWVKTEYLRFSENNSQPPARKLAPQPAPTPAPQPAPTPTPIPQAGVQPPVPETFTLVQYNLVYSSLKDKPSNWESELVDKTLDPKTGEPIDVSVKPKNVKWKNRFPRLIANMKIDGKVPDILLLQETSPEMLKF